VTLFFHVRFSTKIKLALIGGVAFILLAVAVPGHLAERFATTLDTDLDVQDQPRDPALRSIIASSRIRRSLLLDSLRIMCQHPFFGVGLGNFVVAQNDLAVARGEHMGYWHVTHNAYTQIASESGVPGFVLFLLALVFSFRAISRTGLDHRGSNSPTAREMHMLVIALRLSLVAYLSCCFFASLAYEPVLSALCGLAVSLELCGRRGAAVTAQAPPASVTVTARIIGASHTRAPLRHYRRRGDS